MSNRGTAGRVLYASHAGVHVLRFVGDIRYPLAPSVERFVDRLLSDLDQAPFVIDLTKTQAIDSTNLGLLARIAIRMRERAGPRVTIVSDREDISELLNSMGFDEVFDIQRSVGATSSRGRALAIEDPDPKNMARTVLEAHRALITLNEHNRNMFQDVTTTLEQQVPDASSPT